VVGSYVRCSEASDPLKARNIKAIQQRLRHDVGCLNKYFMVQYYKPMHCIHSCISDIYVTYSYVACACFLILTLMREV
jgi:hypothetical protein